MAKKKQRIDDENYNDGYYHLSKDLRDYPEAVIYVIWSRRGPGKTYSGCRYFYNKKLPFMYVKRTKDDVNFICNSDSFGTEEKMNPYSPLNRDFGLEIKSKQTGDGRGIFYEPIGDDEMNILAYVETFNNIKKIKGFDMSFIDYIWMDEFIPVPGEIVRLAEGEMLLSLYMTVLRDRMQRGRKPLKMILTSNTDEISTPITRELEIIDDMAEMNATGENIRYIKDRKILLHHITDDECPNLMEPDEGIYAVMRGTQWADKNLFGLFAGTDFSNVGKQNIKAYKPIAKIIYKRKNIYIYRHKSTGGFYLSYTSTNHRIRSYNLERDSDIKSFYWDFVIPIRDALLEDKFKTEKFSMYDLIVNYKQYYKV